MYMSLRIINMFPLEPVVNVTLTVLSDSNYAICLMVHLFMVLPFHKFFVIIPNVSILDYLLHLPVED